MRRILVSVASLLFTASPTLCADLPTKAPYYYPGIDWTGTYIGAGAGGATGKSSGALGTLDFGINFQTYTQFVFGLEADSSLLNLNDTGACAGCNFKTNWLSTGRGRIGYMFGRTLLFATGGVAVGNVKISGPTGISSSNTRTGFAVGGGLEFDLMRNWSLRADYLHVDLGKPDCSISCGAGVSPSRLTSEIVRFGIVYRFFQAEVEEFNVLGPGVKPPPP